MSIIFISLSPILAIAFYIFKRDKYEKEPGKQLIISLIAGVAITIPIIFVEQGLNKMLNTNSITYNALYSAFVVAAFTEETFKYLAFIIIIWRNKNFNEFFDGIVYATYISLGFAAIENVLYVYNNGFNVGILRAFTAVPAHALFGITMGYYLALAKFENKHRTLYLLLAILAPIALHGIYDFCLMSGNSLLLIVLLIFFIYMWISGFKKMKKHSQKSVFSEYNDIKN